MVSVVVFCPEHLERIHAVTQQPLEVIRPLVKAYADNGCAFSGIDEDGTVVCIAGLRILRDGLAEGWAIMSQEMPRYRMWMHKTVKRMLPVQMHAMKIRRVQVTVEAAFVVGIQWAERLGFQNETPNGMDGYGPNGERHYLYARLA